MHCCNVTVLNCHSDALLVLHCITLYFHLGWEDTACIAAPSWLTGYSSYRPTVLQDTRVTNQVYHGTLGLHINCTTWDRSYISTVLQYTGVIDLLYNMVWELQTDWTTGYGITDQLNYRIQGLQTKCTTGYGSYRPTVLQHTGGREQLYCRIQES